MKIQWKALAANLALALGTGLLSSLFTPNIREEYAQLYRPPLAPPGWVFPVVWTVLFILMGLAAYFVTISENSQKESALKLYVLQLLFNLGWTVLFFRFGAYLPAFLWLIILWFMVFVLVKRFSAIDELSGKLLMPYLIWLTFAAYLNLSIALYYL